MTCGCVTHPGETHEEHMDRFDRERNKELMDRALADMERALESRDAVAFYTAQALVERTVRPEILRLKEKERLMRAGLIPERGAGKAHR